MKGFLLLYITFFAFSLSSCNECTDCEPFNEEPYLKIRFYNQADSSKKVIIIDSVNQDYVSEFRHFQDTTYEFRFALDMHHDTSVYQMVYRDTSNLSTYLTNEIIVTYNREFLRRDDNYIIVECDLDAFTTDLSASILICNDNSTTECISNEAIANTYN